MLIKLLLLFVCSILISQARLFAQDEPGLSGFIQLSGAYMNFKTNTVAGFLKRGISEPATSSLYEKPHAQQVCTSMGASEIKYTFKNQKWQLYFGGSLLDIVRLELVQQFAVRMFPGKKGYLSLGVLGSGVPVSVWTDPYAIGIEREETIRKSLGLRFDWTHIGQTNFGIQYDFRTNTITEKSGEFLGLSDAEKALLDRNGYGQRIKLSYFKEFTEAHTVIPAITYKHINTKGNAKKGYGIGADVSYGYKKNRITSATNVGIGIRRYASENPIYDKQQQNYEFSISENIFYVLNNTPKAALILTGSVSYVLSESNIAFHSQNGFLCSLGLILKYGPILAPNTN